MSRGSAVNLFYLTLKQAHRLFQGWSDSQRQDSQTLFQKTSQRTHKERMVHVFVPHGSQGPHFPNKTRSSTTQHSSWLPKRFPQPGSKANLKVSNRQNNEGLVSLCDAKLICKTEVLEHIQKPGTLIEQFSDVSQKKHYQPWLSVIQRDWNFRPQGGFAVERVQGFEEPGKFSIRRYPMQASKQRFMKQKATKTGTYTVSTMWCFPRRAGRMCLTKSNAPRLPNPRFSDRQLRFSSAASKK